MEPLLLTRRSRPSSFPTVALSILLGVATFAAICALLSAIWVRQIPTSFAPILADTAAIKSSLSSLQLLCLNIYSAVSDIYSAVLSIQDQVSQLVNPWSTATFAPEAVLLDALYKYDQHDYVTPADTVLAVGPERVVVPTNSYLNIYDKATLQRVGHANSITALFQFPELGDSFTDPDILFDEGSQKFFVSMLSYWFADAQVQLGTAAPFYAQTTDFGQQPPYTISAEIVVADPIKGAPALNNAAAMPGKIALFERGSIYFSAKVKEAEQAGAVAAIVFNNVPGGGPQPFTYGCCLPITIPSVEVTYETGQALLALIAGGSTNVTIRTLADKIVNNKLTLAVSKTASPSSVDDFYGYYYETPETLQIDDYPKIAIDRESTVSISVQLYNQTFLESFVGVKTYFFDKAQLMAGPTGLVAPIGSAFLPAAEQSAFLYPSRSAPAPVADASMPLFFVGYDGQEGEGPAGLGTVASNLIVYPGAMPAFGVPPFAVRIAVPFPLPTPLSVGCNVQQPLDPDARIEGAIGIPARPVVAGESMWVLVDFCPTATQASVLWMRLDLSQFLPALSISIAEWGVLDLSQFGPGTSAIMPSVNVDAYGNAAISFTLVGPTVFPTLAYAARPAGQAAFSTDYQIAVAGGQYGYLDTYPPPSAPTEVRWGDYSALVVDPVDHRTFYAIGMYPSQALFDNDGTYSYAWSAAIARFRFRPLTGVDAASASTPLAASGSSGERTPRAVRNPAIVNATTTMVDDRVLYTI